MYHISANLAVGRLEKIFWGKKSFKGRQIGYMKAPKKVATFFFIFFKVFVGRQKNSGGARW